MAVLRGGVALPGKLVQRVVCPLFELRGLHAPVLRAYFRLVIEAHESVFVGVLQHAAITPVEDLPLPLQVEADRRNNRWHDLVELGISPCLIIFLTSSAGGYDRAFARSMVSEGAVEGRSVGLAVVTTVTSKEIVQILGGLLNTHLVVIVLRDGERTDARRTTGLPSFVGVHLLEASGPTCARRQLHQSGVVSCAGHALVGFQGTFETGSCSWLPCIMIEH